MAGPLAAMERFFERLFERPAARLLAPRLEPVHLQRHLERAMESAGTRHRTRIHVPSRYRVLLHTADLVALSGREALPAELAESLRDYARRRGYLLASRPTVKIEGSPRVSAGQVLVLADPDVGAALDGAAHPGAQEAPPARAELTAPTTEDAPPADGEPAVVLLTDQALGTSVFRATMPSVPRAAIAVRGPGRPLQRVPVNGTLRVGRARDNDIVVDDGRVSRHHAQISVRHGTLVYTDLDSTNGSYLYGNPVHEIALGPNDVIHLGASSLTIETTAG